MIFEILEFLSFDSMRRKNLTTHKLTSSFKQTPHSHTDDGRTHVVIHTYTPTHTPPRATHTGAGAR